MLVAIFWGHRVKAIVLLSLQFAPQHPLLVSDHLQPHVVKLVRCLSICSHAIPRDQLHDDVSIATPAREA